MGKLKIIKNRTVKQTVLAGGDSLSSEGRHTGSDFSTHKEKWQAVPKDRLSLH